MCGTCPTLAFSEKHESRIEVCGWLSHFIGPSFFPHFTHGGGGLHTVLVWWSVFVSGNVGDPAFPVIHQMLHDQRAPLPSQHFKSGEFSQTTPFVPSWARAIGGRGRDGAAQADATQSFQLKERRRALAVRALVRLLLYLHLRMTRMFHRTLQSMQGTSASSSLARGLFISSANSSWNFFSIMSSGTFRPFETAQVRPERAFIKECMERATAEPEKSPYCSTGGRQALVSSIQIQWNKEESARSCTNVASG